MIDQQQQQVSSNSNTIDQVNNIIDALLRHLEQDNCECCKSILKSVFE